jgi:hypothetical protein
MYGSIWLLIAAAAALSLRRPQVFVWTLVADGLAELTRSTSSAAPSSAPGPGCSSLELFRGS